MNYYTRADILRIVRKKMWASYAFSLQMISLSHEEERRDHCQPAWKKACWIIRLCLTGLSPKVLVRIEESDMYLYPILIPLKYFHGGLSRKVACLIQMAVGGVAFGWKPSSSK